MQRGVELNRMNSYVENSILRSLRKGLCLSTGKVHSRASAGWWGPGAKGKGCVCYYPSGWREPGVRGWEVFDK